ncbi:thioredoxin [Candidatus Bipolaricaulota bacterium]
MTRPVRVTGATFDDVVLRSDQLVLVDFWASWCLPCKESDPILEELAVEYEGRATIAKVQVDQNPGLRNKYGIQGVPTFIVFKSGEPSERRSGAQGKQMLISMIDAGLT